MNDGRVPDLRRLGRAVSRRRRLLEWSQARLAREAGVSRPHLRTVEEGAGSPGLVIVAQIARALDVTVDDLLREAGWLPGPDLVGDLAGVYDELSPEDRAVLVNIGHVLQEARRSSVPIELEPVAAYDADDPGSPA